MSRIFIFAIFTGIFSFTQVAISDDNNSTINIVHPIDHTTYPHPDPEPLSSFMQTFSFGATCRDGGRVTYILDGNTLFEDEQDFFGHISLQFGYQLKPGSYTFTVILEGSNCKGKTDIGFDING